MEEHSKFGRNYLQYLANKIVSQMCKLSKFQTSETATKTTSNSIKNGKTLKKYIYFYIQGVPGGMCNTSGGCSLGQTIPI